MELTLLLAALDAWCASRAMASMITPATDVDAAAVIAEDAYTLANAMIAERRKP